MAQVLFGTLWCAVFFYWMDCCNGSLEIVEPFYPYFIKVGDSLELHCTSSNQKLEWERATPDTLWEQVPIVPAEDNDWVIRTTVEQPTGFVETVLIKKNMKLGDRGNYYCQDDQEKNSFSIWVTTLQVYKKNVTAVEGQTEIQASCVLTGFDMNPPPIEHEWYLEEKFIPFDSPRHIIETNETEPTRLGLTIKKARKKDTGWYYCRFYLETNISPLEIEDRFYIDTSRLPSSGSRNLFRSAWIPVLLAWAVLPSLLL